MNKKIIGILGLSLNLIGSILMALSLKVAYCGAVKICGLPTSFAFVDSTLFYTGVSILFLGFLLQLIERLKRK